MAEEDPFVRGIRWFSDQAPEVRFRIIKELQQCEPQVTIRSLAENVAEATGLGSEKYELACLLEGIAPLIPLIAGGDANFRNVILNIAWTVVGKTAGTAEKDDFQSVISELLTLESPIGLTGKAQNIIWGHGKAFKEAHVITQIRPIFPSDLQANDAVVVHELRIDYRDGTQEGSYLLILDNPKIRSLIDVLDRALRKDASLKQGNRFRYLTE